MKSQSNKLPVSKLSSVIFWVVSGGTTLFLGVAFFYWTIVPYMQSNSYLNDTRAAYSSGDFSIFSNDQFVFDPDSNVQGILRSDFLRQVLTQYNNGNIKTPTPLLDKAISEMEEYVSNHVNYYTYIVGLANAYATKASLDNNPKYLALEEKYYKQAMETIPKRQDISYSYSLSLMKEKRGEEAVALIQKMVDNNPDIYANNYQLGEIKMMLGKDTYTEALGQFEMALNHDTNINPDFTKSVYQELLRYYYENNDSANFMAVIKRLETIDPAQKIAYTNVLEYMKQNGKIPKLNIGPAGK